MSASNCEPASTAILLTPRAGGAAIAVLRLAGPNVATFLANHFSRPNLAPGQCLHGKLSSQNEIIDDPLVFFSADAGFADINLHGGAWIIDAALDLARREGFTVIDPPPLPLDDAALDPDDSILLREMLAALPLARTELAIRALLEQPAAWRNALAQPDKFDPASILKDQSLWRLLHPPTVALIGEPNVGKSTLANQLFAQDRSITADMPGTTRDWVGELANIDGLPVTLLDTPGQRDSTDPIEQAAIASSLEQIRQSDLTILVLDATRPPTRTIPANLTVINKIDLPLAWDLSKIAPESLKISARSGQGVSDLGDEIRRRFGTQKNWTPGPRWWTQRQKDLLASAIQNRTPISAIGI